MAVHRLKAVQTIPGSLDQIWDFFSRGENLPKITPPEMDFQIISEKNGGAIYAGQIIEYKVRPVFNIPVYWMTEITQVQDRSFFIDEQRKGPYSLWHHQHHFRKVPGGVEMTDLVHYQNPMWIFGEIANGLMVKSKLKKLFEYRWAKVEALFGAWEGKPAPAQVSIR